MKARVQTTDVAVLLAIFALTPTPLPEGMVMTGDALADLLEEREAREVVEAAVRKVCPLANNEGYEDDDGDVVMYRCMNEDGDAFIETESLAQAVEGIVASYERVCEAHETAQGKLHTLTAEVQLLREYRAEMEKIACEGYRHWDNDEDSRAGKALAALGGSTGLRPTLDAIRERLDATPEPVVPHGG